MKDETHRFIKLHWFKFGKMVEYASYDGPRVREFCVCGEPRRHRAHHLNGNSRPLIQLPPL